jgi:DNA-3-methyladenine glycosylase
MTTFKALPRVFYEPSAQLVAPALLGHWLVRQTPLGPVGGPIVETEAYLANDAACHAAPGLTARNRVMFGPPGHAYVYFIYGCHFCVNAVCRPAGTAEAVLIRAIEAAFDVPFMISHRGVREERQLTNGPAKLCQAMNIDRTLDGSDLCDLSSVLMIAQNPEVSAFRRQRGSLITTVRVGITQAADLPFRFYLSESAFVSRRLQPAGTGGLHRPSPRPRG